MSIKKPSTEPLENPRQAIFFKRVNVKGVGTALVFKGDILEDGSKVYNWSLNGKFGSVYWHQKSNAWSDHKGSFSCKSLEEAIQKCIEG